MSAVSKSLSTWVFMTTLTGTAHSAALSFSLDQSNALADGIDYLQVTVADGADGAIDFTVEVLGPLLDLAAGNFGLQSFGFNVVPGGDAEGADITNLPDGWRARNGKRMDGFGLFDIRLQGRGHARLETLTFSISGVDGDTPEDYAIFSTGNTSQGHQFFAAHVAGFELPGCDDWGCGDSLDAQASRFRPSTVGQKGGSDWSRLWQRDWHHDWDQNWDHDWYDEECVTSAYFGGSTAVPLPGAAWLFGAGIAGVALRARRRKA